MYIDIPHLHSKNKKLIQRTNQLQNFFITTYTFVNIIHTNISRTFHQTSNKITHLVSFS